MGKREPSLLEASSSLKFWELLFQEIEGEVGRGSRGRYVKKVRRTHFLQPSCLRTCPAGGRCNICVPLAQAQLLSS